MEMAAKQYKAQQVIDLDLGVTARDPWDYISASMKNCGSKESWTPSKVKYAWHHGVSGLLPGILIVCEHQE